MSKAKPLPKTRKAKPLPIKEELSICTDNLLFGIDQKFHERGQTGFFDELASRLREDSKRAADGEAQAINYRLKVLRKIKAGKFGFRDQRSLIKMLRNA